MSLCQTLTEFYPPKPTFTDQDLPDLGGKVYLITGGTSGIGFILAKTLYAKHAKVYITSRSAASGEKAISEIKESAASSRGELRYLVMDLGDLQTVVPAVKSFLAQETLLHSVWFNAGVMKVPSGSITKQGYELQWGTNVAPKGSVRVVWVSSDGHSLLSPKGDGIDWEDITTRKPAGWMGEKGSMTYYGQSKAGNVLLAMEVAKRYGNQDIIGVSLNPGHLKTNLQRHSNSALAKRFEGLVLHDPSFGALTELYAGFSDAIGTDNNGAYIIPWGRVGKIRQDIDAGFHHRGTGKKLWDILEKETGEYTLTV
ncbi:short chain dehydrogenase domain-containing protein [Trichoderma breve]|uniref:Short chain dehydrogenase domain-containing protein n=1 Tax=Trichoderma breve TaxID=2034170 RepID=A0A9W9EFH1_9HYPO|nr:short chain dehydrogenase domain-containing protein [Trichoderma breve]KAJ4865641.1 short chain dehydrogenase domain-containing protein [Trichoderma breve]